MGIGVVGIVAFSFGLRENEPNPCNVRLAEEVIRAAHEVGSQVCIVAQWEIARALQEWGLVADVVVDPVPGKYLGSADVAMRAKEAFQSAGVQECVVIAQPFLHLSRCKRLMEMAGFRPRDMAIGRIGFDSQSTQWWTRGPIRLLLYAVLQRAFGYSGKPHVR